MTVSTDDYLPVTAAGKYLSAMGIGYVLGVRKQLAQDVSGGDCVITLFQRSSGVQRLQLAVKLLGVDVYMSAAPGAARNGQVMVRGGLMASGTGYQDYYVPITLGTSGTRWHTGSGGVFTQGIAESVRKMPWLLWTPDAAAEVSYVEVRVPNQNEGTMTVVVHGIQVDLDDTKALPLVAMLL